MSQNKTGGFLVGTIVGGLIGAAVALLYAPKSGEETRTEIRDKSVELKDRAVEKGEAIRVQTEELTTQTRAKIDQVAETTKARGLELQERSQTLFNEQKARLEKAIDATKQLRNPQTVDVKQVATEQKEDPVLQA